MVVQGIIKGTTIWATKGDARSLDYGSYEALQGCRSLKNHGSLRRPIDAKNKEGP